MIKEKDRMRLQYGNRRRFLGGAAVAVGLPFFESLQRRAHAQVIPAPARFMAIYVPNGMHMPDWTPTTTGTDWSMPYILAPLESLRSKIAVLTGLDHHQTAEPMDPPGGHASGTGAFLTMRKVNNNANDPNRTSLDQLIAAQAPGVAGRPLPSLQLGLTVANDGGTDGAPSTAFNESIAWNKNTPLPNITSPQTAFDRIFAGTSPTATNTDALKRAAVRTSVLDHVLTQAQSLRAKLNATDRIKADQYLTSIRALETRIQTLNTGGGTCMKPAKPTLANTAPYAQRVPIMFELAALALQCDVTRVITFMVARSTSLEDFSFVTGKSSAHHNISHHRGVAENLDLLRTIGRWEMEQVATFLKRIDGMIEGNGKSVLDNMSVFLGSDISDGNSHKHYDMPILLAGNLGGRLKTGGNHVMYTQMIFPRPVLGPSGGPHTGKLFISIANAFGIPITTFGDGSFTGPLTDVMA
ncbi:MAG: DUF1552 domain-containing protein [Pseudomonadota bacterium]